MASESDLPDLNFLTQPEFKFDIKEITEKVLWPLVDLKWQGDFRRNSLAGMPMFTFPKAGMHEGRLLEVTLSAGKESETEQDTHTFYHLPEDLEDIEGAVPETVTEEVIRVYDTVTIMIEEAVTSRIRQLVEMAAEYDEELLEGWVSTSDDDEALAHELIAKEGIDYSFFSDGSLFIRPYSSLVDFDGDEIWNSRWTRHAGESSDPGPMPDLEFTKVDHANLTTALHILEAPPELMNALKFSAWVK